MATAGGGYVDEVPNIARVAYFGFYQVSGIVNRLGVPGRYYVELRWKSTLALLRGVVSDQDTGAYSIPYLPDYATSTLLLVRDTDWRGLQPPVNAAISDQPVFEAMP